jgi:putative flippase GtrA
MRKTWIAYLMFCLVGFSGMVVDFGITYLLKEFLHVNKFVANSVGFTCAAVSNYYLNSRWTFRESAKRTAASLFTFLFISVIGLVLNNTLIYLMSPYFNFYLCKLISTLLVSLFNFTANARITFSHRSR